ncbi:pilus assembly protein CpaB [Nocardioides guangzhouensis]|uniref:Pilus assembly protein CpaB n=1 Tax=Nocardioides guangzhouensis TaxID=2497878 RepID=A0A4Q4ZBN6_9ACTN|nr:SAF domain-containing protein [Nocardioides guangzhouensis]RYP85058.1 pilus assembly protein CpaB [Nocardioides guangzhouensis]
MPRPRAARSTRADLAAARRAVRRRVLRHRRLLSALCVGGAVLAGLHAVAPPPPTTVTVLVAARDLPAGTVLASDDLAATAFRPDSAPDGVAARGQAVGRTLAAPLRRGEPVTDVRLVGPSLLHGYPGLVAVPVRIPDPGTVDLLRVGDRVDLLVTETDASAAQRLAGGVPVLALPRDDAVAGPVTGGVVSGRLVVLGTSPGLAGTVSAAAVRGCLVLTLSG